MTDPNEAAARLRKHNATCVAGNSYGCPYANSGLLMRQDVALLADAMLDRLSIDEAERIERAKPADIEWLTTIPGSTWFPEVGLWSLRIGRVTIDHSHGTGWWTLERVQIWPGQDATRGQLLDLLRALRVDQKELGAK